jgi:ribonuclease T2
MEQKWPNVKSPTTSSSYQSWSMSDTSFWSHEWDKHGTCSNMDQYTYFHTALQLLLPTPTIIKERYDSISDDGSGGVVTRSELIAGYATSSSNDISSYLKEEKETVLVCSKSGYLSEVRVCYEKKKTMTTYNSAKDGENGSGGSSSSSSSSSSGNGNVGKRITCPNVILKEDNCGETIKLASFNEHKSNVADIYL